MTDFDVFVQFSDMMGYQVDIKVDGEITFVCFGQDIDSATGTSKPNTFAHGYDSIDFLGVFSSDGGMIRAYNMSHVALPRADWCKLYEQDSAAYRGAK